MAQSTVYPEKIKILGNKVYIRDLDSVVESVDENDNTIYSYDEIKLTKDEFELQKIEQNDIDVKELKLQDKIKMYRWQKQKWFIYDGFTQRFTEYDIQRMQLSQQALTDGIRSEIEWAYPVDDKYKTVNDPLYFKNMLIAGIEQEDKLRAIEKQLLSDDTVTIDNYKDKFDELLKA